MLNVLVETKNEYTTHLINILTPLVFEGIQSVYKQSCDISKNNDVLKIFQSFLKLIPNWNQVMIDQETNRIINSSHSYDWLNDLIKATLKANLIVLMYNPTCNSEFKVEPSLYQNIKTYNFIHRIYIECARELWNNPYLLYHNYPPIEIKRNQRDCMNLIKDCIKEALRKLLPVKHILKIYLGEDIEVDKNNNQFEKALTEVEERNLTKIIHRDLGKDLPRLELIREHNTELNELQSSYPEKMIKSNSDDKTIGSKILDIINNNSITSSEMSSILAKELPCSEIVEADTKIESDSSLDRSSISDLKNSIKQFEATLNKSTKPDTPTKPSFNVESIDDKIKKILQKDLATNSELDTDLNYSQEDNENKYQEIFSNSIISPKKISIDDTKHLKDKKKFFNNYLHF